MAGLKKVCRRKERVVPVQGVHQGEVALVQLHGIREVWEDSVNLLTELAVGKQTRLARQSLDGHALEDGLERVKLLGQRDDGVCTGEKAPGGGHQEGRQGVVIRTSIREDLEGRYAGGEGTHCVDGCVVYKV